jgi:hypothetical protein
MTNEILKCKGPVLPLNPSESTVHWLPFAAQKCRSTQECDVTGYFVVSDDPKSGMKATFRGRNLRGIEVEKGEFKWYARTLPSNDAL